MIPKIIPVWKKVGQSTHVIAQVLAKKYGVKAAHTGILDPMAEGVIVVLLDEERFLKPIYTSKRKVYEVSVLVGVETDTQDLLGVVRKVGFQDLSPITFDVFLNQYRGTIKQAPPAFSAIQYQGKRLFEYAKEGNLEEVSVKPREVTVFEVKTVGSAVLLVEELRTHLEKHVYVVAGEFRQDMIRQRWQDTLSTIHAATLSLINFEVTSGPGFYVRGLVRDLSKDCGVPLVVYSLVRAENAGFKREDCVEVEY